MLFELTPSTRQRIIDSVNHTGKYKATHSGIRMAIQRFPPPEGAKIPTYTLAVWSHKTIYSKKKEPDVQTYDSLELAVESFNEVLKGEAKFQPGSAEESLQ